MGERMLTDKQLAQIIGVTVACIRSWRYEGRGPKFLRLGGGGAIRYRESDVREYFRSCEVLPGSQSTPQRLAAQ